jgi:hypothetical protein
VPTNDLLISKNEWIIDLFNEIANDLNYSKQLAIHRRDRILRELHQHPIDTTQDLEAQTSADNLDERHTKRHEQLSEIIKALMNNKQLYTRWKRYHDI